MPAIRGGDSKKKTRRHTRDVDQIYGDLRNPRQLQQLKDLIPDEDKPALGAYHCIECAKYFEQEHNLAAHKKGKTHKRRLRQLKDEPYSEKEALAAAGIGSAAFYAEREEKKSGAAMEVDA